MGGASSSSGSTAASAASAWRRKAQVAQFIRAGESNNMFREKAPSIVPNETGLFLPPSARAAALAAERKAQADILRREHERRGGVGSLSSSSSSSNASGAFSIPLLAAAAGAEPSSSGSTHFFVPGAMTSSPMGMSRGGGIGSRRGSAAGLSGYASDGGGGGRTRDNGGGYISSGSVGVGGGAGGPAGAHPYTPPMFGGVGGGGAGSGYSSSGAASPQRGHSRRNSHSSEDGDSGAPSGAGAGAAAGMGAAGPKDSASRTASASARKFSFMGLFRGNAANNNAANANTGGGGGSSAQQRASSPSMQRTSSHNGSNAGIGGLVSGGSRIPRDRRGMSISGGGSFGGGGGGGAAGPNSGGNNGGPGSGSGSGPSAPGSSSVAVSGSVPSSGLGASGVVGANEAHLFEEARRRAEAREANLLAPFLEARGSEDFVTYDLTRQQDYHKQRKELARQRFAREKQLREGKNAAKKRRKRQMAEAARAAAAAEEGDDNEEQPLSSLQRRHRSKKSKAKAAAGGGGIGDGGVGAGEVPHGLSSSSSEEYVSDADGPTDVAGHGGGHGHGAKGVAEHSLLQQDAFDADTAEEEAALAAAEWAAAGPLRRIWISIRSNVLMRIIFKNLYRGQGWLICALIGAITGLLAALVDLAVQWLIDLKSGYCQDTLYLGNSFCCAGSQQWVGSSGSQPLLLMCPEWTNWDQSPWVSATLSSLVSPFFAAYLMYVVLGTSMACLAAWLVLYYAPHASGSGIPEIKTILGGVVVKKYLGGWTLLIKTMATALTVGAGMAVGKEGAFVHVACCVANILCRYFPEFKNNQYKKNEAISAASAAGISVAFGAPVGGVLFSLEEVASYFPHKTMWRAFFCALVASVVLQSIDPYQEGKLVLFQISYSKPWMWFEILPFALLGVLGGFLGAMFIRLNTRIARFRREAALLRDHPVIEVMLVAFVTVSIKYLSAYTRGNQNAVLASLFGDCKAAPFYDPLGMCDLDTTAETIGSLLLTSVATFVFTSFTWSLCVPGGIFIPAMLIGAANGRVVGTLMRSFQASSSAPGWVADATPFTPGIYALVGSAAMLGGVTRMTVCLVVIMFELTGAALYLLPLMIALVFAKVVGDAFDRRSIFDAHLGLMNYPFLHNHERVPPGIRVRDAMSRDLLMLPMHGHSIASLKDQLALLAELRITGFPIVTTLADRLIVGYINRSELYTALALALRDPQNTPATRCYFAMLSLRFPRNEPYVDLRPWLHPSPIQVVEHTPLYRVHDLFKKMGLRSQQHSNIDKQHTQSTHAAIVRASSAFLCSPSFSLFLLFFVRVVRYALVTNFGKLTGILTKKDLLDILRDLRENKGKLKPKSEPPQLQHITTAGTVAETPQR